MDEIGFNLYMKRNGNSLNKILSYINRVKRFEKYLTEETPSKNINDSTFGDLEKYVEWCEDHKINPYQELWGIREYYEFLKADELFFLCNQVMQMIQIKKFKLKEFMTANKTYADKLSKIGIKTASHILEKGKTRTEREKIAGESGVPIDEVLKFVKLANLARCPGHMKKRACLYYEAGLDTFNKISKLNPETMIKLVNDFIEKTGFDSSPPTLGEATLSIENSKRIPRIIDFELTNS